MTNNNEHLDEQQRMAIKLNHLLPLAMLKQDKDMLDTALEMAGEHFTMEQFVLILIEGLQVANLRVHDFDVEATIKDLQEVVYDITE